MRPIAYNEARKRANKKYAKENMKGYTVTVNKKTEPEMYQFLMNAENKQRTIKAGISLLMNQKKRQENT